MKKMFLSCILLLACKDQKEKINEPPRTNAPAQREKMVEKPITVYAKGGLRLRDAASINGKTLLLIPHLANISVEMIENHQYGYRNDIEYWLKTKYSGKTGFVSSLNLKRIIKRVPSADAKFEVFQLAPFNREGDSSRESTEVILTNSAGDQLLKKTYIDLDSIFWQNERYAIVKTSRVENSTSYSTIDRLDTATSNAERIISIFSLGFGGGGPGDECTELPGCVCGYTVFILQNRSYYLYDTKPYALYQVLAKEPGFKKKYPKANNNCAILNLKSVKLIKNFPGSKDKKIDHDFYEGLKFSIDDKSYIIPWNKDSLIDAP